MFSVLSTNFDAHLITSATIFLNLERMIITQLNFTLLFIPCHKKCSHAIKILERHCILEDITCIHLPIMHWPDHVGHWTSYGIKSYRLKACVCAEKLLQVTRGPLEKDFYRLLINVNTIWLFWVYINKIFCPNSKPMSYQNGSIIQWNIHGQKKVN